jgi:heme A synthase
MNNWARYVNIVLGVWLVISAFAWPHTVSQQTNAWVVGLLVATIALVAIARDRVRYLNTALAVWLFISIWALPGVYMATAWNSALVAIGIFMFSLVPDIRGRTLPTRPIAQT